MKHKRWSVEANKPVSWIIDFMRKYLKLDPQERLVCFKIYKIYSDFIYVYILQFLYINQTFAPSPDQTVRNLYDCYNTEGKLILHYCKSQAWG